MSGINYADFYRNGPLRDLTQDHVSVGSFGCKMFQVQNQPSGFVEVPGATCPTLQLSLRGNGQAQFDLGAGRFRSKTHAGCWLVTPANQPCSFDLEHDLSLMVLELPDLVDIQQTGKSFGRLHERCSVDTNVSSLVTSIWADSLSPSPLGLLWSDSALITLRGLIDRFSESVSSPKPAKGGLAPWQRKVVTEYLTDYAHRPISLYELSQMVGLSQFHFARAFKQSLGCAPYQFQIQRRMDRAKSLLEGSQLPITEIALEIGYESSQSFSKAFFRSIKMTPSLWRRHFCE
jgi:AraC family transcriptional regulator